MQWIPIDEEVKEIHMRVATEQGIEKGRKEGIEIGMEKGREEGKEIGLLQVARSMLNAGFPPEVIQKYTGLDRENILALR